KASRIWNATACALHAKKTVEYRSDSSAPIASGVPHLQATTQAWKSSAAWSNAVSNWISPSMTPSTLPISSLQVIQYSELTVLMSTTVSDTSSTPTLSFWQREDTTAFGVVPPLDAMRIRATHSA